MLVNLSKRQISLMYDAIYDAIDHRRNHASWISNQAEGKIAAQDQYAEAVAKDHNKIAAYKALADEFKDETCL